MWNRLVFVWCDKIHGLGVNVPQVWAQEQFSSRSAWPGGFVLSPSAGGSAHGDQRGTSGIYFKDLWPCPPSWAVLHLGHFPSAPGRAHVPGVWGCCARMLLHILYSL